VTDEQFADKLDDWATEGSNFHDPVGRSQLPLDLEVNQSLSWWDGGSVHGHLSRRYVREARHPVHVHRAGSLEVDVGGDARCGLRQT